MERIFWLLELDKVRLQDKTILRQYIQLRDLIKLNIFFPQELAEMLRNCFHHLALKCNLFRKNKNLINKSSSTEWIQSTGRTLSD